MGVVAVQLDKLKLVKSIANYSDLADLLGVHRQTVSLWRKGDAYPEEDRIARMAELAGADPITWLLQVREERAVGHARRAYHEALRRLGAAASLAVVALFAAPQPVNAGVIAQAEQSPAICIMRS